MPQPAAASRKPAPVPAPAPPGSAPATPSSDPSALAAGLAERLDAIVARSGPDPFANPILLLALDIHAGLQVGELTPATLEGLVQHLGSRGFADRAARLSAWLGEADPERNTARVAELIDALARDADGGTVPFDAFRAAVEGERFGVVFTAHPTFNLGGQAMRDLAGLATGRDATGRPLTDADRAEIVARVAATPLRPDEMTLEQEHSLSLVALANFQDALRRVYATVLAVARDRYPDRWMELTPRLLTVASWVGYDLDGRSDIRWTDTLHKRLIVQQRQLRHYLDQVQRLRRTGGLAEEVRQTLELLESRLALAMTQVTDEIAAFGDGAADVEDLRRMARRMHEALPLRLVDAGQAIELVDRTIRRCCPLAAPADADATAALLGQLCVLRAELSNYGLGMAHTHVRINATQLHNAIRKQVGMETAPDDPRYRQSYLAAVTELLDGVEPATINFGSIIAERTSAKRLFMVVAQMLKYSDATTPVRFLIAESESAFTVLAALYYARLFGIADRVDISPLFETEKALELGSRVIEQLLDNPHYRDYVRGRGRVCVQTGYSDAGRYLGQTPAAASIERLRLRLLRLFAREGLEGVQLVIFDTHGESIGRGGHPRSFVDRLSYVSPPGTLAFAAAHGIDLKQEVSFQGGDGFLSFITPPAALASVTRILEYVLDTPKPPLEEDPFYTEPDYIREFFTTVKTFQVGLVADPDYGALLSAYGTNLLYASGSRAIKRQTEAQGDAPEPPLASQFRAIPHNAILQQLGLPANTISGVGEAIDRDPDRFLELYRTSARFRQLMGMVEYGVAIAVPDALRAYVDLLDPRLWLLRASHATDACAAEEARRVAAFLEEMPSHARQSRVLRRLLRDFGVLRANLERAGLQPAQADRRATLLLHAVRIALMLELFRLATLIPSFSSQHSVTHRRLVGGVMHLDVPWALSALARIFPATPAETVEGDFGEAASYASDEMQNYSLENERIFRPMATLYELVRRCGNALTQRIGFFG